MPTRKYEEYSPISGVRARDKWGRFCNPSAPVAVVYAFEYAQDPGDGFEDVEPYEEWEDEQGEEEDE